MAVAKVRSRYFDPSNLGSLSSRKTFLKYNPDLRESDVNKFFAEENAPKRFYPSKVSLPGEVFKTRAHYFGQYVCIIRKTVNRKEYSKKTHPSSLSWYMIF